MGRSCQCFGGDSLLGMKTDSNYYVYAYFDPRNFEMLYVGKGKGSRKNAHLPNKAGSAKERQLHQIERAGLEPLIRVVAASLTEDQALLVEKALIWRAGGSLTNVSRSEEHTSELQSLRHLVCR